MMKSISEACSLFSLNLYKQSQEQEQYFISVSFVVTSFITISPTQNKQVQNLSQGGEQFNLPITKII